MSARADAVAGAGAVREEDSFDAEAVADALRAVDPSLDGTPEVRQFSGGASNLTYLLRYPEGGPDLILRRPPSGTKAKGAHNMRREHDIQAALRPIFAKVPRMLAYLPEGQPLDTEAYVMERLEGTILRKTIPDELGLTPSRTRALCEAALDTLVELHSVDITQVPELACLDRGDGYVRRQVEGWSGRYRKARTKDVGSFERVMEWLDANQPADLPHTLIHNDFRLDNLVLDPGDPTRVVGVLDWEMATVGDPLMDLGGAMAYWVEGGDDPLFRWLRLQPTHAPGMMRRDEIVQEYCRRRGIGMDSERWTFYEVFGLFRLAVIAQQIYYRYHHGQTTNKKFKNFRWYVLYLEWRCRRLVRGRTHLTGAGHPTSP